MGQILTVARGLPSVVYPAVELSRRLQRAGHHVTFAGAPETAPLAVHHGLAFLPLEPSDLERFQEVDGRRGAMDRLLHLPGRLQRAVASTRVAGFGAALRAMRPDLVLLNGEMHEHVIVTAGLGIPLALLNTFVSIWRCAGLPPPHHSVRPGAGLLGTHSGMALLWVALWLRKQGRAVRQAIAHAGCDRLSVLRRLAEGVGFDFGVETDDTQWLIPFTYARTPVLSLHAREFEFPHVPPAHVRYVGPMVLETRLDRPLGPEDRGALEAVIARRRHGGDRRLLYAAFGSTLSTDLDFLRRLVGVVAERPAWELIVSLSDRVAVTDLGPLPARVHVFPWLPQLQILEHADVMVTHGGINTIDECVLHGVPVLVYCGFQTDMGGTTARVVHHGIGIAGAPGDATSTIRAHVDRLLREPKFTANTARLRAAYERYAAEGATEQAVAALLRDAPAPRAAGDPVAPTGGDARP